MKVLVSACIMGTNCKYNGKNNKNLAVINFLKDKEVISICPEILAGMKIPRPCAEIVNGIVVDENGNDVNSEYNKAVSIPLISFQSHLKTKIASVSCGSFHTIRWLFSCA